jgi:predicted RNase H-like HicB family nuclease
MLTYKAAYFYEDESENGWVSGHVIDFPAAISQGRGLEDARRMLASALADVAESYILEGQTLPAPDATCSDPDADLQEPIYLLLEAASHVRVVPEEVTA